MEPNPFIQLAILQIKLNKITNQPKCKWTKLFSSILFVFRFEFISNRGNLSPKSLETITESM